MKSDPVRALVPNLVTVDQAAEYLNLSRSSVYGLIQDGALVSARHNGRRLISEDSLVAYVETQAAKLRAQLEQSTED